MTVTLTREEEFRETDLMGVIRRLMREGRTGQMILDMSQGRVLAVRMREIQKSLDSQRTNGTIAPVAVAQP